MRLVKEWLLNFKGCVVVRIAMVEIFWALSQCQKHGKAKKIGVKMIQNE